MDVLKSKVLSTILRENLLQSGDVVYVALSGGADSVAMLHILLSLREELSIADIHALHVHHGIRGENSDRDERFVRDLCSSLSVPISVHHVDIPLVVKQTGESVEEAARRLRYAFFESQTTDHPHAKIATAHTASDQAETVLLNLIRGSGLKGAAGIPIRRGNIVRPLLDCGADEVRQYCRDHGYTYQVDETNTDLTFARNRVRHEILPSMRQINPQTDRSLIRFAQIAEEDNRFLDNLALQLLQDATLNANTYDVSVLAKADPVLCKRALSHVCYAEFDHLTKLLEILPNGGSVNLPRDICASSDGVTLRFSKLSRAKPFPHQPLFVAVLPDKEICFADKRFVPRLISYQEYQEKLKIHKNLFDFCISYDMIDTDLVLRSRQTGDTIRPFGRGCTKSIKKLFNEQAIPCEKRDFIPVLSDGEHVCSLPGLCVDEAFAVKPQTKRVLWFDTNS